VRKIRGGRQAGFAGRLSNRVDGPAEISRRAPDDEACRIPLTCCQGTKFDSDPREDSEWTEELTAQAAMGVWKEDVCLPFDF